MQALPKPTSVLDAVYVALRDSICDGDLPPGERITQDEIAERLGVSRQPVGQALLLLKSQGFVSQAGRRGLIVAPLGTDMVRDIYEVRAALDDLAARLAARRSRPDELARGYEILREGKRLMRLGDVQQLVKADMAFHEFIYELSGNPLIRQALTAHWQQLRRVMSGVIEQRSYRKVLWTEHDAILNAIRDGDGERATKLSRAHVQAASDALCKRLETKTFV
jgi:DNA-binding GntR family transcriptional regulator